VPQPTATFSGAGTNLPQVKKEGGLQASIIRLPASSSEVHPYHHATK